MKAMMQSMKRRFSGDAKKKDGAAPAAGAAAAAGAKQVKDWTKTDLPPVNNPHLPLHRRDRCVSAFAFQDLPLLSDVPTAERDPLFIRKLRLCAFVFEFEAEPKAPPSGDGAAGSSAQAPPPPPRVDPFTAEKEVKRQALLELVDYLNKTKAAFSEPALAEMFDMVSMNLFRPLRPASAELGVWDPEEDEPALEPAWPHLQIVYEFLLRFIISTETDQKLLKKFITTEFIGRLLQLFDSEDPRERDYLKTILHRIYGKFMPLRSFIRKAVNHVFFRFVFESERHNGIAELLEILGSIINGFALPLKPEHKQFLLRVLLPLHKPKYMPMYHPQLSYCITQFVEKDPSLAPEIVERLVSFWPRSCSKKEVMYLNELEEILERLTVNELEAAAGPLFRQLSKCVQSTHFQVAERAICLLNYDILLRYISSHREQTMPPLLRALQTASVAHWNPTVCELTSNNLRLLMEMDEAMAEKYAQELLPRYESEAKALQARRTAWNTLDSSLGNTPADLASAAAMSTQQRALLSHRASITYGPLALKYADACAAASVLGSASS